MDYTKNNKIRIIIVFVALFLAVSTLLMLIFFAGKKTYTVTFDLNGGTLLSGSLTQHVTRGQNASPPKTVKEGAYFLSWSESYREITRDIVIEAIWEYETTPGIVYADSENQNYTEITGAYKYIKGDVYIGSSHGDKKVLGIKAAAFAECVDITKVYLLDGLLTIEEKAFYGCTKLMSLELGEGLESVEYMAFGGCTGLERLILPSTLKRIEENAFEYCGGLKTITLRSGLETVGDSAFLECAGLKAIYFYGDEASFDAIEIAEGNGGNDALAEASLFFYSESEPLDGAENKYWHYDDDGNVRIW